MKKQLISTIVLILFFSSFGCTKPYYSPQPFEDLNVKARAETSEKNMVTVSAAILNKEESQHVFGVDIAKAGVQPVWVNIKNGTDEEQLFLHMSISPDYFSPHEVWWKTRNEKDKESSRRMASVFRELMMPSMIAPHSEVSGFVLVPLHSGSVRLVNIDILGLTKITSFSFFLEIPGFLADHHLIDPHKLYQEDQFIKCDTLDELRTQIELLPCCVTNKAGNKEGDPLNIVIVTPPEAAWRAVVRRGWDETEPITGASAMKTVDAFMAHKEYKTSPISALYVFGRGQDIGLQKARKTIHERNHLRLWLTPITYKDQQVWVGTISRDIGVKMTSKAWNLTTHEIDGNVDEARTYLIQDLAYSQALDTFAFSNGVGEVDINNPRLNLTDSPWYTDGYRAILFLSDKDTSLVNIKFLDWEHPY